MSMMFPGADCTLALVVSLVVDNGFSPCSLGGLQSFIDLINTLSIKVEQIKKKSFSL